MTLAVDPPKPLVGADYVAPLYQWIVVQPGAHGADVIELTEARSRRLSFALDDSAAVGWTMPGRARQTARITEVTSDLVVARNRSMLFRGRVNASDDTVSPNVHTCTFGAVDYRGMLDRRILWPGSRKAFAAMDQGLIVKALIDDSQALGTLGVTFPASMTTGVVRDRNYNEGEVLGELIGNLGRTQGGFEWDVSPALQFRLFYPQRGNAVAWIAEYGHNVTDVRRTVTTGDFANAIRFSGADTIPAVTRVVAPGVEGRWEKQLGNTDVTLAATLNQQADFAILQASAILPAYTISVQPGHWTPATAWLGDTVRLIVRSGRLNVDTSMRVVGIGIDIDDNGVEGVTLDLGTYRGTLPQRLADYRTRIQRLERR